MKGIIKIVHICLVDFNNSGYLYRCGIESELKEQEIVRFWQLFSSDVRYVTSRPKGNRDTGTNPCSVGTIVTCKFFGDKVGHLSAFNRQKYKIDTITACGVDDRQVIVET